MGFGSNENNGNYFQPIRNQSPLLSAADLVASKVKSILCNFTFSHNSCAAMEYLFTLLCLYKDWVKRNTLEKRRQECIQQVRIQDLVKGGAASETESCRHSEVESRKHSEPLAAGVQGPLKKIQKN